MPTFQVEPLPVTVTVGVKSGSPASIATRPRELSTPLLEIVTDTGPPIDANSVNPLGLTVTVDQAPSMTIADEKTTARLGVCSVPPLMTESSAFDHRAEAGVGDVERAATDGETTIGVAVAEWPAPGSVDTRLS